MSFTAAGLTPGAIATPIATDASTAASEMRRMDWRAKAESTDERPGARGCEGGAGTCGDSSLGKAPPRSIFFATRGLFVRSVPEALGEDLPVALVHRAEGEQL